MTDTQPKAVPKYLKIVVAISIVISMSGAVMSIAGPFLTLNADITEVSPVNREQISEIPGIHKYFRCDKPSDPPINVQVSSSSTEATVAGFNASVAGELSKIHVNRGGEAIFKNVCEDAKLPHEFLACASGCLTLMGVIVLILCMCIRRPEPEFVFIVPLVISLVALFDFMSFNSSVFAFVQDCTVYTRSDDLVHKLGNIVIWAPSLERWGILQDGENTCSIEGNCSPDIADNVVLCSRFYDCSNEEASCNSMAVTQEGVGPFVAEDKAVKSIQDELTLWYIGVIFNCVGMGALTIASFVIRVFVANAAVSDYMEDNYGVMDDKADTP